MIFAHVPKRPLFLAAGITALSTVACADLAGESDPDASADQTAIAKQPLVNGSVMGYIRDATGSIEVQVIYKDSTGLQQHPLVSCGPDPAGPYVLVSGGAEVRGTKEPGALLVGSFPTLDATGKWTNTWNAESKDHEYAYGHTLRCVAFALKVGSLSPAALKGLMAYVRGATTATTGYSYANASLPAGYKTIGGGARAGYSGAGRLLVASRPGNASWTATSKDHRYVCGGTTEAFAAGIHEANLEAAAGFPVTFTYGGVETLSNAGGGYKVLTKNPWIYTTWNGYAISGVGGMSAYDASSWGRLLTQMTVTFEQSGAWLKVTSKDHGYADGTNFTILDGVGLRRN